VRFAVPTARDVVDGTETVSFNAAFAPGSVFPIGPTLVNCSAQDSHGHVTNGSFTVTVADATKPVIRTPGNITVKGSKAKKGQLSKGVASFTICASDTVDGSVSNVTTNPLSGTSVTSGTVINVTAADHAGNISTASFTVNVVTKLPKPSKKLPVVSLSASAPSTNEGGTVTFTAMATAAPNLSQPTFVNYSVAGAAIEGTQYTLTAGCARQIVIPAGAASGSVTLHARVTPSTTGSEPVALTVIGGSGYTASTTANSATVTINNIP
jgi:hypothetical protein